MFLLLGLLHGNGCRRTTREKAVNENIETASKDNNEGEFCFSQYIMGEMFGSGSQAAEFLVDFCYTYNEHRRGNNRWDSPARFLRCANFMSSIIANYVPTVNGERDRALWMLNKMVLNYRLK